MRDEDIAMFITSKSGTFIVFHAQRNFLNIFCSILSVQVSITAGVDYNFLTGSTNQYSLFFLFFLDSIHVLFFLGTF